MIKSPKISIIIPCYNYGKYLMEAVNSVLNQTFTDFEIIIVDDGSTDPFTLNLLKNLSLPHTKTYFITNQGVSNARNYGSSLSKGEFVLFLDADDYLSPNYLEKTISILENKKEIDFVSTWTNVFGTENYIWKTKLASKANILGENTLSVASLFRKSMFVNLNGYDCNLKHGFEDWELWIRILSNDYKGYIIEEPLFNYRKKTSSLLSDAINHKDEIMKYILKKHETLLNKYIYELAISKEQQLTYFQNQDKSLKNRIGELDKQLKVQVKDYHSLQKEFNFVHNQLIQKDKMYLKSLEENKKITKSATFRIRDTLINEQVTFRTFIKFFSF